MVFVSIREFIQRTLSHALLSVSQSNFTKKAIIGIREVYWEMHVAIKRLSLKQTYIIKEHINLSKMFCISYNSGQNDIAKGVSGYCV